MKKLIFAFILLLAGPQAFAEETPWHKVELLVYALQDNNGVLSEHWPKLAPFENTNWVEITPASGGQPAAYERLDQYSLPGSNIERSSLYRVLFHSSWLQPVGEKNSARPVHIQGGELLANGQYELDGNVRIHLSRYLHIRPQLRYTSTLTDVQAAQLAAKGIIEPKPDFVAQEISITEKYALDAPQYLTVEMNQSRRMRSEETHFLDHPLFGVMVKITPLQ